jgi:hypothetical protein
MFACNYTRPKDVLHPRILFALRLAEHFTLNAHPMKGLRNTSAVYSPVRYAMSGERLHVEACKAKGDICLRTPLALWLAKRPMLDADPMKGPRNTSAAGEPEFILNSLDLKVREDRGSRGQ